MSRVNSRLTYRISNAIGAVLEGLRMELWTKSNAVVTKYNQLVIINSNLYKSYPAETHNNNGRLTCSLLTLIQSYGRYRNCTYFYIYLVEITRYIQIIYISDTSVF